MATYPPGRSHLRRDQRGDGLWPRRDIPQALLDQLDELEEWAVGNLKDSRRDSIKFWALKVPALISSAGAGIFAYFGWDMPALILGFIGTLCVLIDGLHPSGMLRNVHLRTHHDLRALQQSIVMEWRIKSPKIPQGTHEADNLAAAIIDSTREEIKRIAAYIRDAETSLDIKSK